MGPQILELGRRLLRLLALCLDLPPGWFLDRFLKPIAILRPLHYSPKLSRPEEVCRCPGPTCVALCACALAPRSWADTVTPLKLMLSAKPASLPPS